MAEFFEKLDEQAIYRFCNTLAVLSIIIGPLVGLIVGKLRKLVLHDFLYGILWGLSGPALALVWALVDARTSYYDYIYRAQNPEAERWLWRLIKPYPVESIYGLATLALGILVAGAVVGVGLGFLTAKIERSFGRPADLPRNAST